MYRKGARRQLLPAHGAGSAGPDDDIQPHCFLFVKLKSFVLDRMRKNEKSPSVTEDELKFIIESIEEEGVLEEQERELVQSALDFDEKQYRRSLRRASILRRST